MVRTRYKWKLANGHARVQPLRLGIDNSVDETAGNALGVWVIFVLYTRTAICIQRAKLLNCGWGRLKRGQIDSTTDCIEPVSCRRVCLLPSRGTESCREYEDQSVANLCDRGWVFSTRLCLLCMPRALCRASSFQMLDYTLPNLCLHTYLEI